jgi:hypothetical protein
MRRTLLVIALGWLASALSAETAAPPPAILLKPARVFDGEAMHEGWSVRVRGDRIEAVGSEAADAP